MNYKNNFHVLYLQVIQTRKRKTFLLLLLLAFIHFTSLAQTNAASIAWNTNFDAAQTLAQSVNRPLFLFFEDVPTNAITLSLIQNTFTNPEVIRIVNSRFVPMRIKNNTQLALTFNVIRYPTITITNSTGTKIINSISGIMSTENVIDLLNTNTNASNESTAITSTQAETILQDSLPPQTQTQSSAIESEDTSTQSQISAYRYNGGSFTQVDNVQWIHETPFYTVNYKVFSDSKFFYYLESEDKKTFVAIPKSQNNSLWIWESNVWRRISREEQ